MKLLWDLQAHRRASRDPATGIPFHPLLRLSLVWDAEMTIGLWFGLWRRPWIDVVEWFLGVGPLQLRLVWGRRPK